MNTPSSKNVKRRQPRTTQRQERGLRMCCACREKAPREELLRFVADGEGQIWLDKHLKAPGRGAHLCYQRSCIERAFKRNAFNASFKRATTTLPLDEFVRLLVEAQLEKISDLIALARRKRVMISGLNMLESTQGPMHCVLFASDIAEGSHKRLLKRNWSTPPHLASAPLFSENAVTWCHAQGGEWSSWCDALTAQWSSAHLGTLVGKASRVALGIIETRHAELLTIEIQRIQQVLVASQERSQ